MSGGAFLLWAVDATLLLLLLALLLTLIRLVRGPTLPDRILALDLMASLSLSFVAAIAIKTGFLLYLDIAISIALVGFLATIALARYVMQRAESAAATIRSSEGQ